MERVDSPAPAHLDDALELAEILRPAWPEMQDEVRRTAAFLNDGEEDAEAGEGQPSPEVEHSPEGEQAGSEDQEPSFLDGYDFGDLPEEARPVADAALRKLSAAYTRQRQQDTEVVRTAKEAQLIVDGLMDPQRAPSIAQALGLQLAQQAEEEVFDEYEDPNDRIDRLEAERAHEQQVSQATHRAQQENQHVTQQIESLEDGLNLDEIGMPFDDDELGLLYLYADEFRDAEGNPDVRSAHRVLDSIATSHFKRMAEIRRRAPRVPGKGSAADREVDLSTEEARVDAGVRAAQQLLASRSST